MVDGPPVIAGFELRALDHFLDGGDRRHQEAAFYRQLQKLGLGAAAREPRHDILEPVKLAYRLGAAEQQLTQSYPILVAGRLVAEALLAQIHHQLAREDPERRAKKKSQRDVTIFGGPHCADIERSKLYPTRHPTHFGGSEGCRQNI